MGFFNTLLKTAVTGDTSFIKRYEDSGLIRGAIIELCKLDGFTATLIRPGRQPETIDGETDLSAHLLGGYILEIDPKRDLKNLYIGIGYLQTPVLNDFRAGKITEDEMKIHHRSFHFYRYETSFDAYRDIKLRISQMLEAMV